MWEEVKQVLRKAGLLGVARTLRSIFRRSAGKLTRQRKIKQYLTTQKTAKLQIGSEKNILDGWLNTDLEPTRGIVYLDARKKFPFDDCSFDYILCEHLIEHIEYQDGVKFLCECFRVLKPGGKIRIATPDFGFLIGLYGLEKSQLQQRYISWVVDSYLTDSGACKDVFVINNFFRDWGHKFIYDCKTLTDVLNRAGFVNVVRCEVAESDDKNLQGLEVRGGKIPAEFNRLETFVCEAIKPG